MRYLLGTAAAAALFAVATPAAAQTATVTSTAEATARGTVLTSQSLTKTEDLDFGVVTVDPTSLGGTVSVSASAGSVQNVTGGVSALSALAKSARFDGLAAPGQSVSLTLNPPASGTLVGAVGAVDIVSMEMDTTTGSKTAGSDGKFTVYVGGEFQIDPDQAAGVYSNTFELTAEYQ
ncbi:DUF4402 domain-containing protein [Sphingomonas piscis]|uniref:DUF4402 domain-containing protein n=1 Tax=Sphingomonas piscis TaxID=2714943 RepID=A0A6G7YN36_9SPHN|nr:DUF4402 domain-containing protein [Sphingomonas piscis]QIK78160.1 DUF4402 domain-containing protein [Sphingomonas piscis]